MSTSPKIYYLKRGDRFYNSKEDYFYESITNANYEKTPQAVQAIINTYPEFSDCEIYSITEDDLFFTMCEQTAHAAIAGAYFAQQLVFLDCRLPTISQVNKILHKKLTTAIDALWPFTAYHKDFLKKAEDNTDDAMGNLSEVIFRLSKYTISDMKDLILLLDGYDNDKKSMLGIAKKVKK